MKYTKKKATWPELLAYKRGYQKGYKAQQNRLNKKIESLKLLINEMKVLSGMTQETPKFVSRRLLPLMHGGAMKSNKDCR